MTLSINQGATDRPKMGFTFSAENETSAKNEILFSARETETKTNLFYHFWHRKRKRISVGLYLREQMSTMFCFQGGGQVGYRKGRGTMSSDVGGQTGVVGGLMTNALCQSISLPVALGAPHCSASVAVHPRNKLVTESHRTELASRATTTARIEPGLWSGRFVRKSPCDVQRPRKFTATTEQICQLCFAMAGSLSTPWALLS